MYKSIYSEFITRVEKRLEEGSGFPNSLFEIPSQTIKFDLLKLLRTQLMKDGANTFQECLKMSEEIRRMITNGKDGYSQNTPITELTSFYTEMVGNTIKSEISGLYDFLRDLLWFSNWLIINNLDTKETTILGQADLTMEYGSIIDRDRKELKEKDDLLSALLCLKISTHSLLFNQERSNDHLKMVLFQKFEVNKSLGLNDVMPFFITKFYTNIVSSHLESLSSIQNVFEVVILNFFKFGMYLPATATSYFVPTIIQKLLNMKEYDIVEKAVGCLKVKTPALSFALALSKANQGKTEEFVKYFCQGVTAISSKGKERNLEVPSNLFGETPHEEEFLELMKN